MKLLSQFLCVFIVLSWLLPSPGRLGIGPSIILLVCVLWASRFQDRVARVVTMLMAGTLLACSSTGNHGGWQGLMQGGASLLLLLTSGRLGFALLLPAVIWTVVMPEAMWAVAFLSAVCSAWKGRMPAPRTALYSLAVIAFAADLASGLLARTTSFSGFDGRSTQRWAVAELLNRTQPTVLLRKTYETLSGGPKPSVEPGRILSWISTAEERIGACDRSVALRIAAVASAGDGNKARAIFAEATRSHAGAVDSLLVWNPDFAPWGRAAAFLAGGDFSVAAALSACAPHGFADDISAELAARVLLSVGLESEACTLTCFPRFIDAGWANYVRWRVHTPYDATVRCRNIGSQPILVDDTGTHMLLRGEPARGVWPRFDVDCRGVHHEGVVSSDAWVLLETASPCSLRFVNDLRSYLDDRNLLYGGLRRLPQISGIPADMDQRAFWQRVLARVHSWDEEPPPWVLLENFEAVTTLEAREPSWTHGVSSDSSGWMLFSPSWMAWEGLSGTILVVMRGQPAARRWPLVEVSSEDWVTREVVDSRTWKVFEFHLPECAVACTLRFVNDYWDPASGDDRNLWIQGLYSSPLLHKG